MSDTPRTDAATHGFCESEMHRDGKDIWGIECVDASFAQQLERKLDAAERKLTEIISVCNEEPIYTVAGHMEVLERILAIARGEK